MIKKVIALLLISLLWIPVEAADFDAMELALLQPYQDIQPLNWEIIDDQPFLLNQQVSVGFPPWKTQDIRMKPGQKNRFYIPAYESLRLYNPVKLLRAKDISAYLSNGSGLLAKATVQISEDKHSLIISPQSSKPLIVHVRYSAVQKNSAELLALLSHRERLSSIAPYRSLKWLTGQKVLLTENLLQVPEMHWQIKAYEKEFVDLVGPSRVMINNRLRYETDDTKLTQEYRIQYQIGDSKSAWLDFTTDPESKGIFFVNTHKQTLGFQQKTYLEIPEGVHRLELTSDRDIYLQVLEQNENDYLIPSLNQPQLSIESIRKDRLMTKQSLPAIKSYVNIVARDNSQQSSVLSGQQLLKQAALERMDYPAALTEVNKMLEQYTFYSNLLPSNKHLKEQQFNAYFINKRLKTHGRAQPETRLSTRHLSAALKRLGNAYFSGLATNNYVLPERYSPTLLRIIIDKEQCREQQFYIQMDQQPAQLFKVRCEADVSNDAFQQSLPEVALFELQKQLETQEIVTLSHLFSTYRKPAKLIPVAINQIVLPQQVRELTVWSDYGELQPLNLALQIRIAKPSYQLPEKSYSARINDIPEKRLFELFVSGSKIDQSVNNQIEQQLQNEWIPLQRLLTRLYRRYKSSIATKVPVKLLASKVQIEHWQKLAQQEQQKKRWTQALANWNKVVEASQGEIRDRAQLAQAAILARLSKSYLAQRLWRYLSLYAQDEIAEQAKNELLTIYRQQHDNSAIQMLAAAQFKQHPDQKRLTFLIESLMENKHYRYSLLLGSMHSEPPTELMLKAAYQLEWWQTYQQHLTKLPQPRQWFWRGLKAQKQGDYTAALDAWEKAGADNWLSHLQQGLAIREELPVSDDHVQMYQRWSQWQQNHPGKSVWKDASRYIKDSVGMDQFYAAAADLFTRSFRGKQQRPVKLQVMGPVTLNFKVKVLHQKPDSPLDGWLQINDNQEQYRYPFRQNKVNENLTLTGTGDYLPGKVVNLDYQVGQGIHQIELSSDNAPISVSISQLEPELALTVLAPLEIDTFTVALSSMTVTESHLLEQIPVQKSTSVAIANQNLTLQSLIDLPDVEDADQAVIRMTQCLAIMEQEKQSRVPLLFIAGQLQQRFPDNLKVQTLWKSISRYSQWQTVNSIASSAGVRFINTEGWQPSSPALGIRKALSSQTNSDEHIVSANQRLLLVMTNQESKTIHVEASIDDLVFLPDSPVLLEYQIDSQEPQQLAMTRSEGWEKLVLEVPTGDHQVRFSIINPATNQLLKLRFQDSTVAMDVSQERSFFISTQLEPLEVYIKGPTRIRIDEWLSGEITSRYQNVTSDWQLLTIAPSGTQQESLLQIRQQVAIDQLKPLKSRVVNTKLESVPSPAIQVKSTPLPETVIIKDYIKPDQYRSGTWSLGTASVRRNNVQEDFASGDPEQFQQFRLNHRYYDGFNNSFWNTQALVRLRDEGSPSFGIKESVTLQPYQWPVVINLEAKAITQEVDNDLEWVGQLRAALSHNVRLTPKTQLRPKLSWFGRYVSLRDSGKVFTDGSFRDPSLISEVDQDVYTAYKSQHSTGLATSFLLTHDPWLDTRWSAKFNSVSNEDMNFFNPDNFSTEVHWKQLLGGVSLDASYRRTFYQKDADREDNVERQLTELKLNWQAWTNKRDRLEIIGQYDYDIERKAHLGMLSLTYHFGEDRSYRNFKSGEIDFRQIRKRWGLDGID